MPKFAQSSNEVSEQTSLLSSSTLPERRYDGSAPASASVPGQSISDRPSRAPKRRLSSIASHGGWRGDGDIGSEIVLSRERDTEDDDDSESTSEEEDLEQGNGAARQRRESNASHSRQEVTPLPWKQLVVLASIQLSGSVAFLCIVPFLPQMLSDNLPNVSKEEIGYYAGLVESSFALVQAVTTIIWGRTSDRIGRKPVLLIGVTGSFISINAFGFAKTLPQMILARCVAGLMGGNIGVLKSVLGEITDETNQAQAFSQITLCFGIGSIIGPFIGGTLADPVSQFPIFRDSDFLKEYPYWLPCCVASSFALFGAMTGFFFLEETLPSKRKRSKSVEGQSVTTSAQHQVDAHATQQPPLRQLLTVKVRRALINATMIQFVNTCYITVLPLFAYTKVESGGLSLTKSEIGMYFGASGLMTIFIQLFVFPSLERRVGGPLPLLRLTLRFLPTLFIGFALAHFAGRELSKSASWAVLFLLLVLRGGCSLMMVASNLCINNVVPVRNALGAINGMSQGLGCLSRAIGPIFANSAFAYSITKYKNVLDGQLVWAVFSLIALMTWFTASRMIVPRRAEWRRT